MGILINIPVYSSTIGKSTVIFESRICNERISHSVSVSDYTSGWKCSIVFEVTVNNSTLSTITPCYSRSTWCIIIIEVTIFYWTATCELNCRIGFLIRIRHIIRIKCINKRDIFQNHIVDWWWRMVISDIKYPSNITSINDMALTINRNIISRNINTSNKSIITIRINVILI